MKFSIVVPVYKVEKYIKKCVDSILDSTFTDFELILVDDGSPDNCGKICDEYAAGDRRIKVIHQNNQGVGMARNAGSSIAKGEYILFFDSDDWIKETLLEEIDSHLNRHSSDVVIFGFYEVTHNGTNEYCYSETSEEVIKNNVLKGSWSPVPWNKCFRRCFFGDAKFSNLVIAQDNYLLPELICTANDISVLEKPLYYYNRTNETAVTNKTDSYYRFIKWYVKKHNEDVAKERQLACYHECELNTIAEARRCIFKYYFDKKMSDSQMMHIKQYLKSKRNLSFSKRFWINRILNDDKFICKIYSIIKGYN